MQYLKLFEEIEIEETEFPRHSYDLSIREKKILNDLVGDYYDSKRFNIKVEDHYYYTRHIGHGFGRAYYNTFEKFSELKEYVLFCYYMDNSKPEEFLDLLKTSELDISIYGNIPIYWACHRCELTDNRLYRAQYAEIVKHLLKDGKLDPSDFDNLCIKWANRMGYTDVIKLLLIDPRVDPSVDDNHCIRKAYKKDIVKLLLEDPRVRSKLTEGNIDYYEYKFDL